MTTYVAATYGALVVMSVLASLAFARYWWTTRDRFFLWFAGAFLTFALNWTLLAANATASDHHSYIYAIRLLGFLQILAAIALKNRRPST